MAGDLLDDRYADPGVIAESTAHIGDLLEAFFASIDSEEAFQGAQARGFAFGPVRTTQDILRTGTGRIAAFSYRSRIRSWANRSCTPVPMRSSVPLRWSCRGALQPWVSTPWNWRHSRCESVQARALADCCPSSTDVQMRRSSRGYAQRGPTDSARANRSTGQPSASVGGRPVPRCATRTRGGCCSAVRESVANRSGATGCLAARAGFSRGGANGRAADCGDNTYRPDAINLEWMATSSKREVMETLAKPVCAPEPNALRMSCCTRPHYKSETSSGRRPPGGHQVTMPACPVNDNVSLALAATER